MKLKVLIDDTANRKYPAIKPEHGVCYHIDLGTPKVLFDLGYSGLFINNAPLMGIDLREITHICFSHAHSDHTGGLFPWLRTYEGDLCLRKPMLIAHPMIFERKSKEISYTVETGIGLAKDFVETFFKFGLTKEPYRITEDLIFLGEIERTNDFENQKPIGKMIDKFGNQVDDYCPDDSAIIYRSSQGIVLITACSHSGICNIVQYAKKVAKKMWAEDHIHAVIGGLHLDGSDKEILENTANFLKTADIDKFYIGHCTFFPTKAFLSKAGLDIDELYVGREFAFG